MGKTAFVFPGQGAQFVGMGSELARQYEVARTAFEEADGALGFSISQLCFEGPQEELNRTAITQPAILTASVAALRVLAQQGMTPDFVAGLSLGEYSAHVAAGSIALADAVRTVHQRGRFMQEAVPEGVGAMAAIMNLSPEEVERLCAEASSAGVGVVSPANYNCPGQIVISGHKTAVELAVQGAQEAGAARAVMLPVSAPFHCPLMEPAKRKLEAVLHGIDIRPAAVPVIANAAASPVTEPEDIRRTLAEQVTSTVRWEETLRLLLNAGVTLFVEIGPGKTLTGFVKRIDRKVKAVAVGAPEDVGPALDSWREVC